MIERRSMINKETLVNSGEDIIMLAYAHLQNKTEFDTDDISNNIDTQE